MSLHTAIAAHNVMLQPLYDAAVVDCAAIGLPDPHWGEVVVAIVQLATDIDNDTLATHCRAALAGYKTPKRWHRVAQLPHNAAGKVDKPLLRSQYKEL